MFSKSRFNPIFFRSIQFKIGLVFSAAFIVLFTILTLWVFYTTYTALLQDEMQFIYNRLAVFRAQYETEGVEQLYERAMEENANLPYMRFFLRFNDGNGEELFFYTPPGWEIFNYAPLYAAVESDDHSQLLYLRGPDPSKSLITGILPLADGSTLQCGVVSASQYRLIAGFRSMAYRVFAILIITAFATGVFVTARSLRPIALLNREIEQIAETGEISHRLSLRGTGDYIDSMANRVNSMLDRIEELVEGLKGTLDSTAHDLRTPLTRLMGRAELALGGTAEEMEEALAVCMEESRHILTMLNTLMDISAAEKGLIRITEEPIHMKELIDQFEDLYGFVAEDRGLTFRCSCEEDLFLRADPVRLNQALANLMDNAVKFTPRGGEIGLSVNKNEGGKGTVIIVNDNGPGIPDEEKEEVWKRLYRGEKSRTSPGMGLGLSMVKAVVEAHKGKIELRDNPGGGSIFRITLP
ncbi:MAG: HAMP domain-containing sensor histidine kinase [Spirochaetales bacterium]|nr:HAMP domain-containing sensor histidine kinase [Spirochaetales bacterium]